MNVNKNNKTNFHRSADWRIGIFLSCFLHLFIFSGIIYYSKFHSDYFLFSDSLTVDLSLLPPTMGRPDAVGGERHLNTSILRSASLEPFTETKPPARLSPSSIANIPVQTQKNIQYDNQPNPLTKTNDCSETFKKRETEPTHSNKFTPDEKRTDDGAGSKDEFLDPIKNDNIGKADESFQEGNIPKGNNGLYSGNRPGSGKSPDLLERYRLFVKAQIGENWLIKENQTGYKENIETWMVFEILYNGEIKDVRIMKSSGNDAMDSAAAMAVMNSSPARPLPPGLNRTSLEMGIVFTPPQPAIT